MIRLRRLPPSRVLRRPRYEVDLGEGAGTVITTTPATRIDTLVGVDAAWALTRAADDAWAGGTGQWVGAAGQAPTSETDPLAGRAFTLWEYERGHGLLLRSPKAPGLPTSVDLLFEDVDFVSCAAELPDLALERAEPDDLARVPRVADGRRVFVLASAGTRHLVVASALRIVEHDSDPELSPFRPPPFSKGWWSALFGGTPSQ